MRAAVVERYGRPDFEPIAEAHRRVESGHKVGSVAVKVAPV